MEDFKIQVGMRYTAKSSSQSLSCDMTVTKNPVANSVECICNICGAVETYKVSMLKNQEVKACKKCKGNTEIGKIVNNAIKIEDYTIHNGIFKFIVSCVDCNRKFYFTKEQVMNKNCICPKCKNGKVDEKQKVALKESKDAPKADREVKKLMPRSQAKALKEQGKIMGAFIDAEGTNDTFVLTIDNCRGSFLLKPTTGRTSKTGKCTIPQKLATCLKCGASYKKTDAELDRMNYQCKECESRTKDGRNIFKNINWVGYIKHNLEVISTVINSEGGVTCEVKCLTCEKLAKTDKEKTIYRIPLVSLLSEDSEFICPACSDVHLRVLCPECGIPHIKTTTYRLYCNKEQNISYMCDKTNTLVSREKLLMYHDTLTTLDRLNSKFTSNYNLDCKVDGRDGFATVLKFKESYTGTDGQEYFSCMCTEHHKLLVLNSDEIRTYKHEYCADTRMMPYNPKIKPKY